MAKSSRFFNIVFFVLLSIGICSAARTLIGLDVGMGVQEDMAVVVAVEVEPVVVEQLLVEHMVQVKEVEVVVDTVLVEHKAVEVGVDPDMVAVMAMPLEILFSSQFANTI
ncbi:hypothetical protein EJD97_022996 [Solanum chilense]|uniref:Transmembrane protein n=1 Tax=Solanum chilense TaxID=4083 RepID=A0A6N2AT51_SOLCI|nr:hypothetical protein EJD97_022996 [Solanum chilense]